MVRSVYIIAEAGVNHNGERDKAFALVDFAAEAGADAVKFQTFNAERLAARSAPKAAYQKSTTLGGESQLEMLKRLELPRPWHAELQRRAWARGIEFLSSAFDPESLDFLETLDLPFYKILLGEIVNGPLLWRFARTGKRLVLSTGMATLGEVEQALAVIAHGSLHERKPAGMGAVWDCWSSTESRAAIVERVTLLHCTSQYPASMEEVNLRAMDALADAFGLAVGYSDHTEGALIPLAAVARGASVIEKHFTLDRTLSGPDHRASLEPDELTRMVREIRRLERALGDGCKRPMPSEWGMHTAARQSLVAARRIGAGEILRSGDIVTRRAGGGCSPMELWDRLGTPASHDIEPREPL